MITDIDLTQTDCNNSNIKTILNVGNFVYSFREKGEVQRRQVFIIGNSENDCMQTIQDSLPAGKKFQVNEVQSIFCTVGVITPIIKKLLYEEFKKEFETETKKGLFTKKGKK